MTVETLGLFHGDSATGELIAVFTVDTSVYPHFSQFQEALDPTVKAEYASSYLFWADEAAMARDEDKDGEYYSILPEELASQPLHELPVEETEAFKLIAALVIDELYSTAAVDALVVRFQEKCAYADARDQASRNFKKGTPVYLTAQAGTNYRDASTTAFDSGYHDALTVLKASAVDINRGKDVLNIYPLPKHMAKSNGKFWAEFKEGHEGAFFMGLSRTALETKAAIYLAWTDKFGA